jgi:prolyl-tRNA synthetase
MFKLKDRNGIGLGRLMRAIVEVHNDEKGILWPEEVAPFRIVISEKTLKKSCVEIKKRNEEKKKLVKMEELLKFLKTKLK